jgi:thiamine-phosphate pyrophosphorylase
MSLATQAASRKDFNAAPAFRLCYITDRCALKPNPLLPRIFDAVAAGVDLIQIREKDLATRELVALVNATIERARGSSTQIGVNYRLDVALALHAAGVHLGRQSLPAQAVRACVSAEFLVGVSCHSRGEALEAQAAGADYLLLGPIFSTPSKLSFGPPLGLTTLQQVAARIKIPILALGGITVERIKPCLEAGAAGIAGISIFQDCDSLKNRVREVRAELER